MTRNLLSASELWYFDAAALGVGRTPFPPSGQSAVWLISASVMEIEFR